MRRLFLVIVGIAVLAAGVIVSMGAGGDEPSGDRRYVVELDNAFGLVKGADVKVAGVRAGSIKGFEVDPKTYRALVEFEVSKTGFGDLRTDAFCETRPQSLIGEYFLDCKPGTNEEKLERGGRIPVEQTGSTIPVDLVNNIMRRPYRERFSILLGELGAALAANGDSLNETIRRANPALRETDKVLAALAEQRHVIRELTDDAEDVVVALADNKADVSGFIQEARDTSRISASRHAELREQFQTFPTFLRELRPTMRLLGQAADRQRPALANLAANAPLLTEFLDTLGPFSEASRPSFRTLAAAARTGRGAVEASTPRIAELRKFAEPLPELVDNLAITLEHLDDRKNAVEKHPQSPGGAGFTGLEAFLQYIFRQDMATNVYDGNSYLLKVSIFLDNICAQYTNAAQARAPEKQRCRAILGPNQPGIDQPDPTAKPTNKRRVSRDGKRARRDSRPTPAAAPETGGGGGGGGGGAQPDSQTGTAPVLPPALQDLLNDVQEAGKPGTKPEPIPDTGVLDYLFGA